jgi:hypothetical protein
MGPRVLGQSRHWRLQCCGMRDGRHASGHAQPRAELTCQESQGQQADGGGAHVGLLTRRVGWVGGVGGGGGKGGFWGGSRGLKHEVSRASVKPVVSL